MTRWFFRVAPNAILLLRTFYSIISNKTPVSPCTKKLIVHAFRPSERNGCVSTLYKFQPTRLNGHWRNNCRWLLRQLPVFALTICFCIVDNAEAAVTNTVLCPALLPTMTIYNYSLEWECERNFDFWLFIRIIFATIYRALV